MGIIRNKEELATSLLRKHALEILEAGYEAINTEKILNRKISVKDGILEIDGYFLNLKDYQKIFFVGIGKCALEGAKVIESVLGNFLTQGAVIDVRDPSEAEFLSKGKIKYFQGTHPYPSEQNVAASKEIVEMVKNLSEFDLVLTLISGGGSALFELPAQGVTLEDIVAKTEELTQRGADIYELNKERKKLSQVKGGKFAQICSPAHVVSLLFSDVLGNDISIIASGPTVFDGLSEGGSEAVKNILLCSNTDALEAMEEKAGELGYEATIETDRFSGDSKERGKELAQRPGKSKSCILIGGETTVKIPETHGEGGRNQSMALAALPHMQINSILVCSASDGWDNSEFAGAMSDASLREQAKVLGINSEEFLEKCDSYNFFKKAGGAISTGKLGNNVSDLVIILYE